jgi:ElaB/YqjD/DUF883 family membrane-anchored ribosome-binding protein
MSRAYYSEEFARQGPRPASSVAGRREPRSSEEAEDAIARTRGRISHTLDLLERRLIARKESVKARANLLEPVGRRVRTSPWATVSVALAAGFILGRRRAKRRRRG